MVKPEVWMHEFCTFDGEKNPWETVDLLRALSYCNALVVSIVIGLWWTRRWYHHTLDGEFARTFSSAGAKKGASRAQSRMDTSQGRSGRIFSIFLHIVSICSHSFPTCPLGLAFRRKLLVGCRSRLAKISRVSVSTTATQRAQKGPKSSNRISMNISTYD